MAKKKKLRLLLPLLPRPLKLRLLLPLLLPQLLTLLPRPLLLLTLPLLLLPRLLLLLTLPLLLLPRPSNSRVLQEHEKPAFGPVFLFLLTFERSLPPRNERQPFLNKS